VTRGASYRRTGAAAYLCLYEEGEIVVRELVDGPSPRVDPWVGFHDAGHATALGKSVLASPGAEDPPAATSWRGTGSDRVFGAGADIRRMVERVAVDVIRGGQAQRWRRLRQLGLPLIAAVNGYALGGGAANWRWSATSSSAGTRRASASPR
jgi:hypothetical protein